MAPRPEVTNRHPEGTTPSRNRWIYALIALWGLGVVGGQAMIWRYQLTPGKPPAPTPEAWPEGSAIPAHTGQPLLLMVAHPKCVCTRASLAELARLVARFEGLDPRPVLYLSLVVPEGTGEGWTDGPVLSSAVSIPDLEVVLDPGGHFAERLGATTSGHVLVYGADDELLFSGGITSARAHEGDAPGQKAIVDALYGERPELDRSAVFGCGLDGPRTRS